jgi:uncharacterized protein (TIGR03437 family)
MTRILIIAIFLPLASGILVAAENRVTRPLDATRTTLLKGHVHPYAQPQYDLGPVAPSLALSYVTVFLKPAPGLETFLADQQNPASDNFHRWLTPEQFGDRFGLSSTDIGTVVSWLESQGLKVHDVARGRHWITFSGTALQTARALHTTFHRYQVAGKMHFANASDPAIPEALAPVVAAIQGLDDFEPDSMSRQSKVQPQSALPDYNSGSNHLLAPDDLATIYNIAPLYTAGFDGTGQKLAIVGRTDVDLTDLRTFRKRFNLPAKDPELVLVGPDPGVNSNDQFEANIDLEWSGAIARNATIVYVYAQSVRTAAQYAIDQDLAPVVSYSFGSCEPLNSPAFRSIAQQANALGITWLVSSGDNGATACDAQSPTPQASKGRQVSFPASLPEVTAVGGSEFNEGGGSYWSVTNSVNGASALSSIPERVWNDTALRNQLSAGGGGASSYFSKPAWQTGPGVPNDNARDLPDVSFTASADHDGYLLINGGQLTGAGGTSVSSPVFAGMVALLNQYLVTKGTLSRPGLGNINPVLYRMAQSNADVFRDITVGDNMIPCEQGSPDCVNSQAGYSAAPSYDLATGLGSLDAFRLASEWNKGASTATTLAASPINAALTDTVQLSAAVTGVGSTTAPGGTVVFLVNDVSIGTASLSGGVALLNVSALSIAAGDGTVTAIYGGDGVFTGSEASAPVKITLPASGAVIVPSVNPNPVFEVEGSWPYIVTLKEKAGVAAKLTTFTVNGVPQNLNFFTSVNIPASGTVSAALVGLGIAPPLNRVFHFAGTDAAGGTWSQDVTVPFLAPLSQSPSPAISLTAPASPVQQNPQAPVACAWSHPITVAEQSGFLVQLTSFTAGSTDFTSSIQQLFGTTRLAPYGTLQGTMCWSGLTPPAAKSYQIAGASEIGAMVSATVSVPFAPPSAAPVVLTVSAPAVTLPVRDVCQNAAAPLGLTFSGSAPQWTASVIGPKQTTGWLTVSPSSGTGSAQLNIQASAAGLSKGVYYGLVSIQATDAIPQSIQVPVTYVVGASSSTSIAGVANAASFSTTFAPGMIMSVFGTELAPATLSAPGLPLPLNLSGVSATVNGIAAPLYFTSSGQLNVQVPYETGAGPAVLGIDNNGQIAAFPFTVGVTAPGVFAANNSLVPFGTGQQGQTLLAFVTGEGDAAPSLATGATPAAATPLAKLPAPRLPLSVTVGGIPARILFSGIPSGLAGTTQVNFTIPANAPLGVQPVVVTVGGVPSAPVTVKVTAAP